MLHEWFSFVYAPAVEAGVPDGTRPHCERAPVVLKALHTAHYKVRRMVVAVSGEAILQRNLPLPLGRGECVGG